MSVWLAFVLLATAVEGDALSRSKAAEARGFELIEKEQWCDAMHAFLEANEAAPSLDLIFNAALAADYADDRQTALKLYADLIGAYPGSERNAEVTTRIGELTAKIQRDGVGASCPARAPDEASQPKTDGAVGASGAQGEGSTGAGPSDPEAASSTLAFIPWTMLAAGALVVVVGSALAVTGAVPYFGHASARSAILEAEAAGADATDAQAAQAMWRASWETWGLVSVVAGTTAGALGGLLGGTGGALGVAGLVLDEDAPPPEADTTTTALVVAPRARDGQRPPRSAR